MAERAHRNTMHVIAISAAVSLAAVSSLAGAEPVRFLEQNWSAAVRQEVYTTTQGSQMIPYDWIRALERSDSTARFLADGLARHGYIPNPNRAGNTDGLPVGFTIDKDRSGLWFGMTCAACHTSRITFKGATLQIDGGPTHADMYALLVDLRDSLEATVADSGKFARFARRVLKGRSSARKRRALLGATKEFLDDWKKFVTASTSDPAWGRTRLDAFGMIFNRVTAIDLNLPQNNKPPNAPVSYPFLWGTSFEDRVQWNGSAPNKTDLERLGRNVGEVLGVFARTDLKKPTLLHPFYKTTVRGANQLRIENRMKTLWSPVWPQDVLGPIDSALAAAGKELFEKHCEGCHKVIDHGEQSTPVQVHMEPVAKVGTDPAMATNACERTSFSGRLEGARMPPVVGSKLPRNPKSLELVAHVATGAILNLPFQRRERRAVARLKAKALQNPSLEGAIDEAVDALGSIKAGKEKLPERLRNVMVAPDSVNDCGPNSPLMAYKSRPLDGIWATAPYLHNGSVANLYELLLPAKDRMESFHMGSREFDPVKVGFSTAPGPNTTELDTTKPGNLNTGHDTYGNAEFSEDDRRALVEYLKKL